MPETFACLTSAGEGGKTRFSCRTDSIVAAIFPPRGSCLIEAPNQGTVKPSARRAVLQWRPFFPPPEMPRKPVPFSEARPLRPLPALIFMSRWLQLPLYLGLIVAQAIYVWLFWQELYYLVLAAFGNVHALEHILDAVTIADASRPTKLNETVIMLVVLGLIDVVMISNLL